MGCERQQTAPMVWWRERRRMDSGQQPWSENDHHPSVSEERSSVFRPPLLSLTLSQFSLKRPLPLEFPETTHASLRLATTDDLPGHAVADQQTPTRTMDYSTSLALIFGGCCSSVVRIHPSDSLLTTAFDPPGMCGRTSSSSGRAQK